MLEFAKNNLQNIVLSASGIDSVIDDSFESFVNQLSKTGGKIVFCSIGKSFWLSKKISATLSSLGFASFCLHAAEGLHGDIGMLSASDSIIFISNSGESKELLPILEYCIESSITAFSITSSSSSTIAMGCKYNIVMPKFKECMDPINPPICASVITLIVGDLICLCLAKIKNFTKQDYSKLHPNGKIGLLVTTISSYLVKPENKRASMQNVKIKNNSTLAEAINKLEEFNKGIIIITTQDGVVEGCFSDGDLKRLIKYLIKTEQSLLPYLSANIFDTKLSNFVTKNPRVVNKNKSLFDVIESVKDKKISHSIVVDDNNKLIDILDSKDFFKWL